MNPKSGGNVLAHRVFVCLPFLAAGAALLAQGPGARVTGEVRDPSGAIIVNALITATNTATNVARTTVSDAAGLYVLSPLAPGSYEIAAEAPGFKRELHTGIV